MKRYEHPVDETFLIKEASPAHYSSYGKGPSRSGARGVVSNMVNPAPRAYKVPTSRLLNALNEGLPISELEDLQKSLNIPMEKLMEVLGIAKSTLHRRRKSDQRLDTPQSDRVIRYARLMSKAIEVFESTEAAREWLKHPQFGLGGATPLIYAQTEVGAREVEDLLGRIEYSVYS